MADTATLSSLYKATVLPVIDYIVVLSGIPLVLAY